MHLTMLREVCAAVQTRSLLPDAMLLRACSRSVVKITMRQVLDKRCFSGSMCHGWASGRLEEQRWRRTCTPLMESAKAWEKGQRPWREPARSAVPPDAQGVSMVPDTFSEQRMPERPLELDLTRTAVPWGHRAFYVRDPDGNVLNVHNAALAAVLAQAEFIEDAWLDRFYGYESPLGMHPDITVAGMEMSTGDLGHGLSVGTGMALGAQSQGKAFRTYVWHEC